MYERRTESQRIHGLRAALIGVACQEDERDTVSEFFELFKTPWEFFREDVPYSVVLSTDRCCQKMEARLVILFSKEAMSFDGENGISVGSALKDPCLAFGGQRVPMHGSVIPFISLWTPILKVTKTDKVAGVIVPKGPQTILRLGYDLFQEVRDLLARGQSAANSGVPSLEIHISMLRKWILDAGISVVEIPPVPAGYDFMCCLTHDVDFAGIRRHGLDRTVIGFLYRATLGCLADVLRGRASTRKLFANWRAVLALPAIHLGIKTDYWIQFQQYMGIEGDLASTFFFIPFKNRPGKDPSGRIRSSRATKYDIDDVKTHIHTLVDRGCEIGLHGLDAWHDPEQGIVEAQRIIQASGKSCKGVRMHWLYFDKDSARRLDKAGFNYDSTLGYNDAVGYWAGTVQAFRPPGALDLLELPLHIQDSALFYRGRMGLAENEALDLCSRLIINHLAYGGVLVVNWHHRSLAPERLWGDFYWDLLSQIRKYKVWFGTGSEVVQWFKKRRMVKFLIPRDLRSRDGTYQLKLETAEGDSTPALVLRIHTPRANGRDGLAKEPREIEFDNSQMSGNFVSNNTEEVILENGL